MTGKWFCQSGRMCAGWERGALLLLTLPMLGAFGAFAQGPMPNLNAWVTNDYVCSILQSGDVTYIGGQFSYVGPDSGSGVPIDLATGKAAAGYPKIHGLVTASAPDGSGGWYVGGSFERVGAEQRDNIAHIQSDGSVDAAFIADTDGPVYALALSETTVYAGGNFRTVGGLPRSSIAAIDRTTGLTTEWDPNAGVQGALFGVPVVNVLAVSGSTVYVGGSFTSIGGQPRSCIAALDRTKGAATAWNPSADRPVLALLVSGTTVYAGGDFSKIGGQNRFAIAALDATMDTNNASAWDPNSNGPVVALAVSGTTVYVCGSFTSIGGRQRNYIAALDASLDTNNATAWNPNAVGLVYALAVSGTKVYVGGDFTSIGGQARNRVAALDAALDTNNATQWNPNAGGGEPEFTHGVSTLSVSGGSVYVGGDFESIGGQVRNGIAALDAAGVPTVWDPHPEYRSGVIDETQALAVSGTTVYVIGTFKKIGGQMRNSIAALDATTGLATAWNPDPNMEGLVSTLAVSGTKVYVGGDFASIGGQWRNRIAELDTATGLAGVWNPNADGRVGTLAVSGAMVYAGGYFTHVGGQPRNHIAALDVTSGNATAWNPDADSNVRTLAVSGETLYAGGAFRNIGGQPRNHIAALDITNGIATAWNPDADSDVRTLAVSGETLYAGGVFRNIGGQPRDRIAALDTTANSNNATAWAPRSDNDIHVIAVSDTGVRVGGEFLRIGDYPRYFYAQFSFICAVPGNPAADSITPSSIRWTWSDQSSNETGFKVWVDPGGTLPSILRATTGVNATNWTMNSLTPNTQYAFQVAATNDVGDGEKTANITAWTLANTPAAPVVGNPTASTLDVALGAGDRNPAGTQYALRCAATGQWVQPGGILGAAPAWNTAVGWGTLAVLNLAHSSTYAFDARARNGAGVETENGPSASGSTLSVSSPTATFSRVTPSPTTSDTVVFTVVFSKPVGTSFTAADAKPGGTLSATPAVTGTDPNYTITLTLANPNVNGTVAVIVPADGVTDLLGNHYSGGNSPLCAVYNWPGFAVQPQNAKWYLGDANTLRVQIAEGGIPTTYLWKFDNGPSVSDGPALAQWLLGGVTLANAGHYWCEVTFDGVQHASAGATILVQPHLRITTPPVGGGGEWGGSHMFEVTASGGYAPLSYQWKKNGENIHSANDSTYMLSGLDSDDSGLYTVEVTDSNGDSIETVPATLTVPRWLPAVGLSGIFLLATVVAATGCAECGGARRSR